MNSKQQFRVLYREFLFRLMDVELLSASARGDSSELFGQFASLLIFVSVLLSGAALVSSGHRMPLAAMAPQAWMVERLLLSITMLVVGLFAVLSWDSTFLDRRDVLVLAPLPIRGRTLFTAKIAAVGAALGLTVVLLHGLSAILWPMALAQPGSGILGNLRFIGAWLVTLFAAGGFLYCAILGVQGVAAQLPRRWYLRVSSFLQMAAFVLILAVFLLQPSFATAKALGAPENQRMLACLPAYWFLGLASELSGAYPAQAHAVMAPLAGRALAALAIVLLVAGGAYLLSYLRTLRKIVEEPDIVPGARGGLWLPRFGSLRSTALVQFTIRSLLRSRQHRVILAFYLGFGFALVTLFMQIAEERRRLVGTLSQSDTDISMAAASVVMLCAWVLGTRVVFSLPLDLRANWVFRVMPVSGGVAGLSAARRALLGLSVVPAWAGCAVFFLWLSSWPVAAEHLLVFGLLGSILADVCLRGFRKIPFTCSYLPGKSNVHLTFWFCSLILVQIVVQAALLEHRAMARPLTYWLMAAAMGTAAGGARWFANVGAKEEGPDIQYEETGSSEVLVLGLQGRG
jgi:hypothetical protein